MKQSLTIKKRLINFVFVILILKVCVAQTKKKKGEPDISPEVKEDITGAVDMQPFEYEEIQNYEKRSCDGECFDVPMNLPANEYWSTNIPVDGWTSSHGTPSVGPNKIWMWSYNNYGEGVNLQHSFIQNREYCMEMVLSSKVRGNATPNPNAKFNIKLTPNRVQNVNLLSFQIPTTPSPNQSVFAASFASYLPSGTGIYAMNFTANNNYNNVWFYPSSPTLPVVEAAIRKLRICMTDFCQQIKLDMNFKQGLCSIIHFNSYVSIPSGGVIIGYIWNFGDGTYSYDANPTHDYGQGGAWSGTLTVHVRYRNRCCTKTIKWEVSTDKCDPCKKLSFLNITQSVDAGMVTFTPGIAHDPYYLYRWYFSDGTTYNTYTVTKPIGSVYWGSLSIYYVEPLGESQRCCYQSRWFRYRPEKEIKMIDNLEDAIIADD